MDKTKKNNVRLNFDFPKEEYPYLKMMLAHKGVSLREFMCELILNAIEDYEDGLLFEQAQARIEELKKEDPDFHTKCFAYDFEKKEK